VLEVNITNMASEVIIVDVLRRWQSVALNEKQIFHPCNQKSNEMRRLHLDIILIWKICGIG
jgi:hypothetical protein